MINVALWIVQVLLALLFLFTGGMKLSVPIETLTEQLPMPGLLVRFIGAAEVLGALGLVLPGLTGIRPGLTPLAAAGLVVIMIGATVITVVTMDATMALFPAVTGLLAAVVAYGRRRPSPERPVSHISAAQPVA